MRIIYLLAAMLVMASCTKTEDYKPLEQNRITEFKVVNLQDTVIYGAIDNIDNTITVYLPFYLSLDVIDPEVKLDANATLQETLEPVGIMDATQTYTVKGADNTSRTYKLIIKIQSTYALTLTQPWLPGTTLYPNDAQEITGTFLSMNLATLSINFVNKATNAVTPVDKSTALIKIYNGEYVLSYTNPISLTNGEYDVKLSFLGHQSDLPSVKVETRAPSVALGYRSVQQGAALLITPNVGYVFYGMQTAKVLINDVWYDLGIENATSTTASLRIPDTLPLGTFWGAPIKFTYKDWPGEITETFGYITISAK